MGAKRRRQPPPRKQRKARRPPPRRAAPTCAGSGPDPVVDRIERRWRPIAASALFLVAGLLYWFRWAPVVRHRPSLWLAPGDLWVGYRASVAFVHGHFGAVYAHDLLAMPAYLLVLAPIAAGARSQTTSLVKVTEVGRHLVSSPTSLVAHGTSALNTQYQAHAGPHAYYIPHPQVFVLLAPVLLVLSSVVLFAADAAAERLGVAPGRRSVLALAEATLLFNVTVLWGHPEEALAIALALYATLCLVDDRLAAAGWLLGAAVAVHPLVVVLLPLFLFAAGWRRAPGMLLRSLLPGVVLLLPPLLADVHATVHALVLQPTYPNVDFPTPLLGLAPKIGAGTVGGGPIRLVSLALAAGAGWLAWRWRAKPELVVWSVALILGLRCYTETVMTAYYEWPALAVAVVVAARRSTASFVVATAGSVVLTITAQWRIGVYPWWSVQVIGLTAVLATAAGRELLGETRSLRRPGVEPPQLAPDALAR